MVGCILSRCASISTITKSPNLWSRFSKTSKRIFVWFLLREEFFFSWGRFRLIVGTLGGTYLFWISQGKQIPGGWSRGRGKSSNNVCDSVRLLLTKNPAHSLSWSGSRYHVWTVPETPVDIWLAIGPLQLRWLLIETRVEHNAPSGGSASVFL